MKKSVLVSAGLLAVAMTLSINPAMAAIPAPPELLKVKPAAVYHASRGQSLAETLAQIAQRSGITFKIKTDLGEKRVTQSLVADNWQNAIKTLLMDYNYTTIQDGTDIKTVIIIGHKIDAPTPAAKSTTPSELIVIEPKLIKLPVKYSGFPAGSVSQINLPISKLLSLKNHTTVGLDLPMGQFNVAHDYTNTEADGSQTWVGYLADQGQGYRMYVSQGEAGTMGMITTPDGTYNIESNAGGTYLVNTNQLQHVGYEGDSISVTEASLGAVSTSSSVSDVEQLQAAVNAAKMVLDAANAEVTAAQNALSAASTTGTTTNNAGLLALTNRLTAAKSAAAKALANYQQVQTALNNAKAALASPASASGAQTDISPTDTTNPPVVDIMVLYTTQGQTAAYAKQRISFLTTLSNQAYADSGIAMKLRLVYTESTDYAETTSNTQALDDLATGNGVFSTISQKRVQYGADLVFLFRPLYAHSAGSCGTTYVEFAAGSPPNKAIGYGTVDDGNALDTAGYYCGIQTFTHETGHSFGLVHDREYSQFPGVFTSAYAWGVQGSFATIMSYKQPGVMYFSTPLLASNCAGQPCGYADNDKTRSSDQTKAVNYTAPYVANFMATTIAAPVLN